MALRLSATAFDSLAGKKLGEGAGRKRERCVHVLVKPPVGLQGAGKEREGETPAPATLPQQQVAFPQGIARPIQ